MNFTKNIHFTRLVKVADRLREFNFKKIRGTDEELFHVDVSDDRGNRHMFKMKKAEGGRWRITDPLLAAWIAGSEDHLHDVIEEELAL